MVPLTFALSPALKVWANVAEASAKTVSRTTHTLCVPTGRKLPLGDFIESSLLVVYVSQAQFGSNITKRNYLPRRNVSPQLQRSLFVPSSPNPGQFHKPS